MYDFLEHGELGRYGVRAAAPGRDHAFSTRRSIFFVLPGLQSIWGNTMALSFFSCGSICLCRFSRGLKYNCLYDFGILLFYSYSRTNAYSEGYTRGGGERHAGACNR